ncbi:hypothetical protein RRG08_025209 [Elysia crispata]|uniref:Cytochrome c oxidase subunit 6B1 n=1 Tax=Elysia crispata TaxID=231223 RepID=A0AAE1AAL9_9GAST|nr:hypothetical protein RRG08_025209 [Elysia crispata]
MSDSRIGPCKLKVPKPCGKKEITEEEEAHVDPCKQFWHPGFDARFPNMNQTRRCWQNYVDYLRCQEVLGEDHEPCEYFKKTYKFLCPGFWIEKWDDQVANGIFPRPKYHD